MRRIVNGLRQRSGHFTIVGVEVVGTKSVGTSGKIRTKWLKEFVASEATQSKDIPVADGVNFSNKVYTARWVIGLRMASRQQKSVYCEYRILCKGVLL